MLIRIVLSTLPEIASPSAPRLSIETGRYLRCGQENRIDFRTHEGDTKDEPLHFVVTCFGSKKKIKCVHVVRTSVHYFHLPTKQNRYETM